MLGLRIRIRVVHGASSRGPGATIVLSGRLRAGHARTANGEQEQRSSGQEWLQDWENEQLLVRLTCRSSASTGCIRCPGIERCLFSGRDWRRAGAPPRTTRQGRAAPVRCQERDRDIPLLNDSRTAVGVTSAAPVAAAPRQYRLYGAVAPSVRAGWRSSACPSCSPA